MGAACGAATVFRQSVVVKVCIMFCLATALWPGLASAHFDEFAMSYARAEGNCASSPKDPATVVFYGDTAHQNSSLNHFHHGTSWRGSGGSPQAFATGHSCRSPQDWQRDSGCGIIPFAGCTRYHGRAGQSYHLDSKSRWETVLTPHFEEVDITCGGHSVPSNFQGQGSGFDMGRRKVTDFFRGSHHNLVFVYRGNTYRTSQCNGRHRAGSNGHQTWIAVNGGYHG